jgi:hypothetical protein
MQFHKSFNIANGKLLAILTAACLIGSQLPVQAQTVSSNNRICVFGLCLNWPPSGGGGGGGNPVRPVPIPALGIGLAGLGMGLARKRRQMAAKVAVLPVEGTSAPQA